VLEPEPSLLCGCECRHALGVSVGGSVRRKVRESFAADLDWKYCETLRAAKGWVVTTANIRTMFRQRCDSKLAPALCDHRLQRRDVGLRRFWLFAMTKGSVAASDLLSKTSPDRRHPLTLIHPGTCQRTRLHCYCIHDMFNRPAQGIHYVARFCADAPR
jgi:hypothetical protein